MWVSADVYKRAAHIGKQQTYDDIPRPTVVQLFQVSRVAMKCRKEAGFVVSVERASTT